MRALPEKGCSIAPMVNSTSPITDARVTTINTQRRVDEASDIVVGPARVGRYEALHQLQPGERGEANRPDHEYAIDYGE
jgi:hypothetical protein